jgi:hypothetical protein
MQQQPNNEQLRTMYNNNMLMMPHFMVRQWIYFVWSGNAFTY